MARVRLTDRAVKFLKSAPPGERYEIGDTAAPGMIVRVTDRGGKTFMLKIRFPGSPHPTRRALGDARIMSLADAREKARAWRDLVDRGIDPQVHERRARAAEQERRANTFAAVFADFRAAKLAKERKGKETAREIERDLIPKLGGRPVTEITDDEIAAIIKLKARTAPVQARNLLANLKRFLQWSIDQRAYGLKISPAAGLKPGALCGDRATRDRVLSDEELFALWRNADRIGYPWGAIYKLLGLTGLRLNEVVRAAWSEIDRRKNVWTIPAARMKGRNGKARAHVVPITDEIAAVLDGLPRFARGLFLFSARNGERPVWFGDKTKKKMDVRVHRTLRALAKFRGDDPATIELEPWRNHDIRRTVRSHLSRLKISEEAREAVLAHVRPGIKGVYDQYDYLDEKREALTLWAQRLRSIVEPATGNVVNFAKSRG